MSSRNKSYRNKTCAYCGNSTGPKGEGGHVFPSAIYPTSADPRVQRLKVPACADCNNKWEKDEAQFRNVIAVCGLHVTAERRELWEKIRRSFEKPIYGKGDLLALSRTMRPHQLFASSGRRFQQIIPHEDVRIVRVIRKVIRGLVHKYDPPTVIIDENPSK